MRALAKRETYAGYQASLMTNIKTMPTANNA
jgi:hypothetical protein